jgi:hypothetical protein
MRHELRRVRAVENVIQRALLDSLGPAELRSITDPDERWRKARHPDAPGMADLSRVELEILAAGGHVGRFTPAEIDEAALRRGAAGDVYDSATGALIASAEEWRIRESVLARLRGVGRPYHEREG